MKVNKILHNFLIWRIRHITTVNFTLMLGAITGAVAGIAAVILKQVVHKVQYFLLGGVHPDLDNLVIYFYPLAGITITVILARYYWKEKLGHGITDVLYTISQRSSIIKRGKMYSRMLTSAITVGFGGSVGLEAPIVVTGTAIGSNIAQLAHLDYKSRTLLIGCGAAGAIAGIFNSPVTGVIFSSEVILAGLGFSSFIPLLIAAVTGSLVSRALLGDDILFSFILKDPFVAANTPYYILLGVLCGLVSLYFTRISYWVEQKITKVKNYLLRALIGGLILGVIIFFLPPIYGEGYDTIKLLLSAKEADVNFQSLLNLEYSTPFIFLSILLAVIVLKPLATSVTIESGGSGGIFAPSLFVGGTFGFFFAYAFNYLTGSQISLSNFTLVGMCGVMSGVLHAPLTAIFLIAEITSGYELFIPLMLVSAISFSTISYFEKYSIYTKRLILRGDYMPHDKDRQLLSGMQLTSVLENDLLTIRPDQHLEDLVKLVRKSKRNIFPVVDENGKLGGIITLDDIRDIMFDDEMRKTLPVSAIMSQPPAIVSTADSMQSIMNTFEISGAWNLPVIDDGKYVGLVSKSRIFNSYRTKLRKDRAE
ncbi:MAG: chloride channel protein [Cyclobacteriaceae bacterium]|nr:chloride channel protein [Cyclobacteriaceae bacterium]